MNNKFLLGIGSAFAVIFAGGVAAVIGITSLTDRATISDYSSTSKVEPLASLSAPAPGTLPIVTSAPGSNPQRAPSTATPAVPVIVTDADLARLADAVKLHGSATGDVGREVWAQQLPVAQKLLTGMCDCDQRNWLNHFVQTGQEAVSGSNHFSDSIQLLATLRRSNQELSAAPGRP